MTKLTIPRLTRLRFWNSAIAGALVGVSLSLLSLANATLRQQWAEAARAATLIPHAAIAGAVQGVCLLALMQFVRGHASALLAGFISSIPVALYMAFLPPREMGVALTPWWSIAAATAAFGSLGIFVGHCVFVSTVAGSSEESD